MKKLVFLPFILLGLLSAAQVQFVVQNGNKTEVFNNLSTAIDSAAAGDTLYLPGGGIAAPATIDKELHWVGHGHYPNSTRATFPSRVTGNITFTGNCDNSSFEGIYFPGSLYFGSADNDAVNVSFYRCRIGAELRMRNRDNPVEPINFLLSECVVERMNANNGSNILVEKSLVFRYIEKFQNSIFQYCDFNINEYLARVITYCVSCLFQNNVFAFESGLYESTSNTFVNNVFAGNLPYGVSDSNTGSDNIVNVGTANIYTTINGNINSFDYSNDYHLQTFWLSSDGVTEVGIYGTVTPYKVVPNYPHISTANVASEAENDQLRVQINAQAQSR